MHPPADACDFARYCSAVDFFSINDHAEGLTPERWQRTIESIRECNARAGDPDHPDLVAFVGWEWTQVGRTPDTHYGHKNVIFPGLADDQLPARPIAYLPASDFQRAPPGFVLRAAQWLVPEPYADFLWLIERMTEVPNCATGVDTRSLPRDCRESADTPGELFEKLAQWQLDSLVIPHGLAWGVHAPRGSRLDNQLTLAQHDPSRQRLLEIWSGHGSSEEYRAPPLRPVREPELSRPQLCRRGDAAGSGGPGHGDDFQPRRSQGNDAARGHRQGRSQEPQRGRGRVHEKPDSDGREHRHVHLGAP